MKQPNQLPGQPGLGLHRFLPSAKKPSLGLLLLALVDQYYAALENQDYATAFQYLDLSIGAPWSQKITQTEFIESAGV